MLDCLREIGIPNRIHSTLVELRRLIDCIRLHLMLRLNGGDALSGACDNGSPSHDQLLSLLLLSLKAL